MLELADVHVHYGLSHVLQGVDLTVRGGEIVGLFGRNGVGKTTLIKAVAGWLAPSSGTIRFAGHDIGGLASERICRLGIGIVPEDRRIFPGLSVEENLKLGFLQRPGGARSEKRQALEQIYARLPRLAERRRQLGTTLSGGEQQMLAIARVLVGRPRLLLIDEPTEGLAPMIVDEIFALISELQAQGIAILLVEQNVQRALEVCGPILALERGRVVFRGTATSIAGREELLRTVAV
jgi:branched-chain amino acid transport system ATP-binding protein